MEEGASAAHNLRRGLSAMKNVGVSTPLSFVRVCFIHYTLQQCCIVRIGAN